MRTAVAALCAGLALAACGSSSSTSTAWKSLRSVRVTVARPGLPPPYGAPKTRSFTTSSEVANVTASLNTYQITQRSAASAQGCGGGSQVAITIVPQQGRTVNLTGYRCGGQTTGNIGGNLNGFLSAVGLPG